MKILIMIFLCLIMSNIGIAQEKEKEASKDTTKLEEVIIVSRHKLSNHRQEKTLSSIDNYLEKANNVTMIKRGNYAWEPTINNMVSERLVVTIDGMQIFGACTDKMDPITSYVDVSNLDKVTIGSGQEGTENGHCVGGGIDLQLPTSKFNGSGFKSGIDLGYETNGNYKATGLDLEYAGNRFFISADGIYRKSDNYDAGNNEEVLYSQFEKYNISLQTGYKFSETQHIDANIIYDRATDVGYPALPMDVSLAEALITSLTHYYTPEDKLLKSLETKFYFNTITHIMDDTKRPVVPIRMDMPGWSDTYGFYSKADIIKNKHHLNFNLSGFYNKSLAEMTMFSNNPNEPDMFMYTWPDIRTLYTGIFAKDDYYINDTAKIGTSIRLGYHKNRITKEVGVESLEIFHPTVEDEINRFLVSLASAYQLKKENYNLSFGLGYGERAPSVSEGYGFFIFNSFDNYDYIGNPNLKDEKSLEANFSFKQKFNDFEIGVQSSYFYIMDYIIGELATNVSSMTIGANGVRVYNALDNASIFDVYVNSSYKISERFTINGTVGYNYGKGNNGENLPLIKPFSYFAEFNYTTPKFNAALQLDGNGNQSKFSSLYGENETAAYAILNLNLGNAFYGKKGKTILKYGIENILDSNYSTYADWNNIPRQGRNFYINLSYIIH
ncbi:TonB-dependent receptor plug domain-containing protein [Winogradskyella schleiferi]|uniref:TonB-dependent receptor plug domain-containing protein n=1 Tax=Winogradskyella schleiferi TaxID=2686078 RepID=UPI0015BBA713|nr:TonB-dependent receptor [Winogradskyella schleiferi]